LKGKFFFFTTLVTSWKSVGGRLLLIKTKMNGGFWKLKIGTPKVRDSAKIEAKLTLKKKIENWKKLEKIGKIGNFGNWKIGNWKFWGKNDLDFCLTGVI
jgi:hypothetical protein